MIIGYIIGCMLVALAGIAATHIMKQNFAECKKNDEGLTREEVAQAQP
ncbi:MAG: hypothetical protein K2X86_09880 [Cytophagaceae bacterium]|nr:hypothetical protein [Cytophagaceae bacterium]